MRRAWLVMMVVACGDDPPNELEVRIENGVIQGRLDGESRAFLGVPYAAPPLGDLRLRPPQPAPPIDGVLPTKQVALACSQVPSLLGASGVEDCLYVNIWTPRGVRDAPVMVWLHGGAFIFGSGGEAYYDGRFLAETYGVVLVAVNYRLGPLGFMAHPALTAEDPAYPSSGNYGLEDQIAALEWVERNISAFGGDPERVLLFGESAGGLSTCILYLSPRTEGLFHAAIAESGLCGSGELEPSLAEAEAAGVTLAEAVGCTSGDIPACLRAAPLDALLETTRLPALADQQPGGPIYAGARLLPTLPNVDGRILERPTAELFAAGAYSLRPLIIGNVRNEGTLFHSNVFAREVLDDAEFRGALARRFGAGAVDAIAAQYPLASFASANSALAEITHDFAWACPARRVAREVVAAGAPVYVYSFERELEQPFMSGLGVFHSSEIPFLFNTSLEFPLGRIGAGQPAADALQRYWTRFAATGDPNGDGDVAWPHYDAADRHLVFDVPVREDAALRAAICDFWDARQ